MGSSTRTKGDDVAVVETDPMDARGAGSAGGGEGPPGAIAAVISGVARAHAGARTAAPGMDDRDLEAALRSTEAARRTIDALELTLVAELNRRGEERGPDGLFRELRLPADRVADMAPDVLALAVAVGPTEAGRRCELAARAATDLAGIVPLLASGQVSRRALEQVHRHTQDTSAETTQAIVEHLLGARRGQPGSVRICGMEPHEIAKTCRRLISRLDPDLMQARAEANRRDRLDVRTDPGPVGTTCLTATLPTEVGAAIKAAVDAAGRVRRESDPTLTAGSARALGLADLVLRGVEVEAQVRLGIPVIASAVSRLTFAPPQGCCGGTTERVRLVTGSGPDAVEVLAEEWMADVTTQVRLDDSDQSPWISGTTIPGVGFVPPDVVAAIVGRLDTRAGRALLDARTGTLLETSTDRYVVPRAQREFVATRDGTCRMWGCGRPVESTRLGWQADVDHALPWPRGGTTPANLSALCRHHHRVKHAPRWTHRLRADGSTEWVTPGGTTAFTFPAHTVDTVDTVDADDRARTSSPPTGTNEATGPATRSDDPPPF